MPPSGTTVVRDRPNQRWTKGEEDALRRGIAKHGAGKWQQIIMDPDALIGPPLATRSNVDLKDKWRNMRPKSAKAQPAKRGRPCLSPAAPSTPSYSGEAGAAAKRSRVSEGLSLLASAGNAATAWQAALDPGSNPLLHPCMHLAQPQNAAAPAALQVMASAWAAAREHHQAMLLASLRQPQGLPTSGPLEAPQLPQPRGSTESAGPGRRSPATSSRRGVGAQLRAACKRLDAEAVSQLLLAGANASARCADGRAPMHELAAAAEGPQAASIAGLLVNILLHHGAQLDVRDAAGATPLHLAADAAMAAVLLAAGAPVDAVNNAGETPLFGAAAANCEPLVLRLLAAGANVDHQDDCGETPLIRAASRDDAVHVALRLLNAGASVDVLDGAGRTALHAAAEAGSGDGALVTALLACGAAAGRLDGAGDIPLVLASRNGHAQVAALLVAAAFR